MAYALALPKDLTDLLYSMRDWRLEVVRAEGGTPSARAVQRANIRRSPPPPTFEVERGRIRDIWAWTRPFARGTARIYVVERGRERFLNLAQVT